MAETAVERKYQMTRISAGDYLLSSNDGKVLWRIYSYLEDGSAEYGNGQKLRGTFWSTARYNAPLPTGSIPDDFLEWFNWTTYATTMRTRAEAVRDALSHG